DEDDLQYWDTLRELMAATQDGHGFVNITDYSGKWNGVGVWPTLIEDRLIVETLTKSSSEKIMLGDEIVSIDGKPALETLRREMDITAGSHQFKKRLVLGTLLYSSSESDSMALTLLNKDGVAYQVNMPYLDSVWKKRKYLYEKIEEVEEGIYYISLDRIEDEDLQQALPELMKAEGIIFELKRYPNCSPEFLRYLTYKPIKSARWNVPKISYPDQLHLAEYDTSGRWTIYPAKQYLGSKKITFVISGRAISYAESLMGIIEHYQLGPIVGEEATAGTNGNVNRIELPGGFRVNYTGMKVLKHDGSQHHLIGIQPTHPVTITQQAIRERRDELIEEALAILKGEK
ncbi:MAG: S41 family peptidase, partial [Bacteroidota bacterium]